MKVSTVLFFGKKGGPSHLIVPKIVVFGKHYLPVYDGLGGTNFSGAIPVAANAVNNTGRAPHVSEIDVVKEQKEKWTIEAAGRKLDARPAHFVSAMAPSHDEYWHRFSLEVLTPDKFAMRPGYSYSNNECSLTQIVGIMSAGCVLSVTRTRLDSSKSDPIEHEEPIYLQFDGSNVTDSKIVQPIAANPILDALGQRFAEGRAAGQTWQPETLKDAATKLIGLSDQAVADKEILPHWLNHAAETVQALASFGLNQESEALGRKFMTVTCLTPHWDLLDGAGELRQRVVDSVATLTTA